MAVHVFKWQLIEWVSNFDLNADSANARAFMFSIINHELTF